MRPALLFPKHLHRFLAEYPKASTHPVTVARTAVLTSATAVASHST